MWHTESLMPFLSFSDNLPWDVCIISPPPQKVLMIWDRSQNMLNFDLGCSPPPLFRYSAGTHHTHMIANNYSSSLITILQLPFNTRVK